MKKILIVDDEPAELELLSGILKEQFPHEVEILTAHNGRTAVSVATIWNADILLLDIEMPGINGIEAARQILEQRKNCKIIFVTAYSLFSYAHDAVKLGASDYILKPVEKQDVIKAVRTTLDKLEVEGQLASLSAETENQAEGDGTYSKTNLLITKVKKYLQYNYMTYGVSLDSVSQMLNLNASYLSVLFKKCTGTNFVDYLTDLKIAAAKQLLEDPLRSASEIAGMVGYESSSYFTRAFKKNTGMTPTEYRKETFRKTQGAWL